MCSALILIHNMKNNALPIEPIGSNVSMMEGGMVLIV